MTHFMYLFKSNLSQSIIAVITTALLARLISPSDFGVMSIAMVFIGLFELFSNSGLGSTIIQKDTLSEGYNMRRIHTNENGYPDLYSNLPLFRYLFDLLLHID